MKPGTGLTAVYDIATRARVGTREGPTTRRARKADAAWFAKRPHRTIRFRDPLPGELAELTDTEKPPSEVQGYPARVVVAQIRPGLRTRRLIYSHLKHEPEAVLRAFMDVYDAAEEQGYEGVISKDDILVSVGGAPEVKRH